MKRRVLLAGVIAVLAMTARADDAPVLRAAERLALDLFSAREDAAIEAQLARPLATGSATGPKALRDEAIARHGRPTRVFMGWLLERSADSCTVAVPMRFQNGRADLVVRFLECRPGPGSIQFFRIEGPIATPTPTAIPMPAAPVAPYVETRRVEARTLTIESDGLSLPAELVMPRGSDGPYPLLVLVPGEGPQDLDGGGGERRPLRDLALALAQEGVASLRFTKRSAIDPVQTTGDRFTIEEDTLRDARAALRVALEQRGVDRSRVYLGGHGLGALLAARLAGETADVRGLLLLSPPARFDAGAYATRVLWLAERGLVEREEALEAADAALRIGRGEVPYGGTLGGHGPAYWQSLARLDGKRDAALFTGPVFVLFGGRSWEVSADDLREWQAALARHSTARVVIQPEGDSWFYRGEGLSAPDDDREPGHIMPEAIGQMAGFLREGKPPAAIPGTAR